MNEREGWSFAKWWSQFTLIHQYREIVCRILGVLTDPENGAPGNSRTCSDWFATLLFVIVKNCGITGQHNINFSRGEEPIVHELFGLAI